MTTFLFLFLLIPLAAFIETQEESSGEEILLASQDGYYLDTLNEVAAAAAGTGADTLECPSNNVITTRYKCNVKGKWVDCTRRHCCNDFTFIGGRCIPKDQDPCKMSLCEQHCSVYLQRVICTCYEGYRFSAENQRKRIKPVCVDINECDDRNGDCEQNCINVMGSYKCSCKPGYSLRSDNRSCEPQINGLNNKGNAAEDPLREVMAGHSGRCFANCESLVRLNEKMKSLQEKVSALSTAVRLSSFASGPPGPPGPPGSTGQPGPRGFPGTESNSIFNNPYHDYSYSMLDAFVPLTEDENTQCRCKRGPQGESGPKGPQGPKGEQGERGLRGPKGEGGSFDFLLLMLADIRHDIVHLQKRVFKGERTPKFDFESALSKKKVKQKNRLLHKHKILEGYVSPAVETTTKNSPKTPKKADVEPTKTTPIKISKIQLQDIEEFRNFDLSRLEDYEDSSSGSDEMTDEDYL